jgi:hypothetical protein
VRLGPAAIGLLAACSAPPTPTPANTAASTSASSPTTKPASTAAASVDANTVALPSRQEAPEPVAPSINAKDALALLFLGNPPVAAKTCGGDDAKRIRCMLKVRFDGDTRAKELALKIYDMSGSVAGIERPHRMDGGWRGMIDLVPEPPMGRHRRHLEWLLASSEDHNDFFAKLSSQGKKKVSYRWQPIELKFFRSVGRTTPSAYANGWSIAWNVSGSLHKSAKSVRETMFHETFHLNDREHGGWSRKTLTPAYEQIIAKCSSRGRKLNTACLTPFAPNDTMVRGGTYYAFQPGNGVWEYAAELAIRYYEEHRSVLNGKPLRKRAFKCGPEPNASTWKLLVDEFFDGIDLVPPCG